MTMTVSGYIRGMQIVQGAMFMGVLVFMFTAWMIVKGQENGIGGSTNDLEIFTYLVPVIVLGGLLAGSFLFKSQLGKAKQKTILEDKLSGYRNALIIRNALFESGGLFSIVCLMTTGNSVFMAYAILPIVALAATMPNLDKVILDLEVEGEDRQRMTSDATINLQ